VVETPSKRAARTASVPAVSTVDMKLLPKKIRALTVTTVAANKPDGRAMAQGITDASCFIKPG
jgi:hypothetical protein